MPVLRHSLLSIERPGMHAAMLGARCVGIHRSCSIVLGGPAASSQRQVNLLNLNATADRQSWPSPRAGRCIPKCADIYAAD